MKTYILLIRNTRYWLVGPFTGVADATRWGQRTQAQANDDPRWQTLELPDTAVRSAPSLFAPADAWGIENGEPDRELPGRELLP